MYTYSLAAAFLLAVTASPLPDLSPLGYLLPTSGQPNIAPILFQDFLAQSSTNLDNYNFEQSQILAQSPETDPGNYKFAQPQVLSQIPSTNSDGYNLRQPQILAESYEKGRPETVRGDALEGNEPIPLPITGPTSNYLPSDIKFQQASCSATSSVCCQRAYNGQDSLPATCAASMYFQSLISFLTPTSTHQYVLQRLALNSPDWISRQ